MRKHRRGLCVLVVLALLVPSLGMGQVMSGTVGLLSFGPGWYSGATRITSLVVTRAGITEVASVALSATVRGGLAGAVIMAMVALEPTFMTGVDAIRTYMNNLGASVASGGLYWPGVANTGPDMFIPGTLGATDFAATMTLVNNHYAGNTWSVGEQVYPSYSAAQTAEGTWYTGQGGYGYASENWSVCSTDGVVCCAVGLTENHSTGTFTGGIAFCGPYTANAYVQTNNNITPPVGVTPSALDAKITADITAGSGLATAAADEAEKIINLGLPAVWNPAVAVDTPSVNDQTAAPPTDGAIVSQPIAATPTTGATTPGAEAANQAVAALPSGGAISSSNPAAGASSATTNDQTYTDPSYSGSLTTVPWATPDSFATRWGTFTSGVMSTGLFGLWGSAMGSGPSGGSSTYTFNAGVFGEHTYDFSSWGSTVFGLLSGLVQLSCGFVALRIACLGHA